MQMTEDAAGTIRVLVQMTEDAAGTIRVEQDRPERVFPQWTHSVRDHQAASGSTGDPQLPICTSSQGRQGTWILSTSCQERTSSESMR